MLRALAPDAECLLAVGKVDGSARAACRTTLVPGLASPGRTEVARELEALAGGFAPDAVHVHNVVNPEALAWAADRGAVATVQDHRGFCPGRGKWTLAGRPCRDAMDDAPCAACFEDRAYFAHILSVTRERLAELSRMRRIVVLSRYMAAELAAVGVPGRALRVIPPFVHGLDPGASPDGPACVLFAGRLVAGKGVRDAVVAWRSSAVDLPLVFAGTGPERAGLEREGFEVLGWVPRERLSSVYARARALLLPPRWQEPFGIAGIEALALGVPVAAWRSGGVAEWHPGPGLAEWGDLDGLAAALRAAVAAHPLPPRAFGPEGPMRALREVYAEVSAPAAVSTTARSRPST